MSGLTAFLLALLTLALSAWVSLLASQQNALLILLVFFSLVIAAWREIGRRANSLHGWKCGVVGAVVGYVAMVLAIAVCEFVLRGSQFFERSFVSNLYFFPSLSLGWLYGGIAFVLATPALRVNQQP